MYLIPQLFLLELIMALPYSSIEQHNVSKVSKKFVPSVEPSLFSQNIFTKSVSTGLYASSPIKKFLVCQKKLVITWFLSSTTVFFRMRFQWEVHCSLQTRKNWIVSKDWFHQFLEGARVCSCWRKRERERWGGGIKA